MRNITDVIYDMLSKFYCNYAQGCNLYLLIIDGVLNAFPDRNNTNTDGSTQKLMILADIDVSLGNIYPDYNTTCLLVGWGILPI